MEIKDKGVLITGAARRIGREMARALAQKGARVAIHYNRSKAEAASLAKEIETLGGTSALIEGDIAQADHCARIVDETIQKLGTLDVLINNAAVFIKTPFAKTTDAEWDQIINTNLKSAFFCAQAAERAMRDHGGKIINIADWAAFRPYCHYLPYCISKAGIIALTKGLARTLAPKITVNAIALGAMLLPEEFDEIEKQEIIHKTPLKRMGSPEDVIQALLFLLTGSDFITGSTLVLDGGRLIA